MENNNAIVIQPKELTEEALAALIAADSGSGENAGFFTKIGIESGVVDSPLKAGKKLETDDVVMKLLHIETAHFTRAVDEKGILSDFVVVAFSELPGCYYMGGKRLSEIVTTWAVACGEEISFTNSNFEGNRLLPKLNEAFKENGNPMVVFKWKAGKSNKYVDVLVVGG